MVMLYTPEGEGVFPVIDVWTVQNGEAIQLFSGRSKNESQESEITFSLYENAGCFYIPVYDSLDHNPVYVHLYGFDENGNFGEVYQYENNAFYMNQLPDGRNLQDVTRSVSTSMRSSAASMHMRARKELWKNRSRGIWSIC